MRSSAPVFDRPRSTSHWLASVTSAWTTGSPAPSPSKRVRSSASVAQESLAREPYGVAEGWGIIGTHLHPAVGRSGFGRRLFASSLAAAKAAGLRHIDASIGVDNLPALAYCSAMGFTPYREGIGTIPHRFDVQ